MFEADEALATNRQVNDHAFKLAPAQPIGSSGDIDANLDGHRELLHRIGQLTACNCVSGDEQYRANQIGRGGVHQWVPKAKLSCKGGQPECTQGNDVPDSLPFGAVRRQVQGSRSLVACRSQCVTADASGG